MTTKTINGKTYLFVKIPCDAQDFSFDFAGDLCYEFEVVENEKSRRCMIGMEFISNTIGKCEIIGKADKLSEEQWKGIVAAYDGREDEQIGYIMIYECYDNRDFVCESAIDSGISLISSLNMKPETTLIIQKL